MARVAEFTLTNPTLLARGVDEALDRVAAEVLRDARDLVPRSNLQPAVQDPSAPVTGHLGNSLAVEKAARGPERIRRIGTSVHYGPYQEFGTRFIPARPFLGPALEKARRKWGFR